MYSSVKTIYLQLQILLEPYIWAMPSHVLFKILLYLGILEVMLQDCIGYKNFYFACLGIG